MIGQTLGHYRIEAQLGAGGMGVVYRARDTRLNRLVALKVLGGRSLLVSSAREDLLREGRAASALNHPNICTVHEIGEADGQLFMVMEYVDGAPLNTLVPPDGLPIELTLRYGIQIADALEHAHEGGIVHRDLKSSNVMVTREGRVKVVDFGLARPLDPARDKTTELYAEPDSHAKMAGTLAYMAPEVLRGQPADAASDIWSLGVLLYEISAGKLPFHGTTTFELTDEILREPVPPPPARVPPALRAIILRCLAKEPKQRYRRAGEVRAALEAVDSFVGAAPAQPRAAHRPRRWPLLTAIAAAVVVILVALWLYRRDRPAGSNSTQQGGRLTLIESSDRRAFDPSLSPDGKMVAFIGEIAGDKTDATDLFVARVSGGGRVQLTRDDAHEEHPRFSPDGERILFARRRAGSSDSEICLIPALGGDITTVVANGASPVWSPDATRLAFIQRDTPDAPLVLATVAADGSDRRVILRGDGTYPFLRNPAWSPDSKQIAVVRSRGGVAAEIWSVPADGSGSPARLSVDPLNTFSDDPVFTPDGRALIHSSNRGGATNLWLLTIASREAVRLTTGPGPDESPSVARDGAIAFVNSRWRNALLVHDLKTGATNSVLTHTPFLWAPAFSPDGRELAFSRGEVDGSWHVWVVPVAGGAARQVTAGPLGEVYPRYLPDGSALLYQTWSAPHHVWRVPRDGGPAIAMTPAQDSLDDGYGEVSPDGRWLAFARAEAQVEHIYVMPVGGGPERRLTASAGTVPRWSPDGRSITFSPDRGYARGIFIISADGTGERRLSDRGGWPVWWPDGTRVGYRIVGPGGNQQILTVPPSGGPATPFDALRFSGANYPFDISPDGRLLATTNAAHVSDEIWLLRSER